MNPLGVLLRNELRRQGWTQNHLAVTAQVVPSTVSKIIHGTVKPELETLAAFARALGLKLEMLIDAAGFSDGVWSTDVQKEELHRMAERLRPEVVQTLVSAGEQVEQTPEFERALRTFVSTYREDSRPEAR